MRLGGRQSDNVIDARGGGGGRQPRVLRHVQLSGVLTLFRKGKDPDKIQIGQVLTIP